MEFRIASDLESLLPPLPADVRAALRDDIAERGLMQPIEVDETGLVLDGHHRLHICRDLGMADADIPRVVRPGYTTAEQRENHAVAMNLLRRNLSKEERQRYVRHLDAQGWSTRRIAAKTGVPDRTIHRWVSGAPNGAPASAAPSPAPASPDQAESEVVLLASQPEPEPERVLGSDGKSYPKRRVSNARIRNSGPRPLGGESAASPPRPLAPLHTPRVADAPAPPVAAPHAISLAEQEARSLALIEAAEQAARILILASRAGDAHDLLGKKMVRLGEDLLEIASNARAARGLSGRPVGLRIDRWRDGA